MLLSRFTFRRGDELFEVLVRNKWDTARLEKAELINAEATPLFLEADDFTAGTDVFALDFFLIKQTGELLEGEDILRKVQVSKEDLRSCLENEIRRLSARARSAYFQKKAIPAKEITVTLCGIASALEFLGYPGAMSTDDEEALTSLAGGFLPRRRSESLLRLFSKWEAYVGKAVCSA